MSACEKCIHYEVCRFPQDYSFRPDTCWKYGEPDRPHGSWKPKQMLVGGNGTIFMHDGYECKCGRVVAQKENFCPECGTDMRPSPSNDCMKRGEQIIEWILQGMKEGEKNDS